MLSEAQRESKTYIERERAREKKKERGGEREKERERERVNAPSVEAAVVFINSGLDKACYVLQQTE